MECAEYVLYYLICKASIGGLRILEWVGCTRGAQFRTLSWNFSRCTYGVYPFFSIHQYFLLSSHVLFGRPICLIQLNKTNLHKLLELTRTKHSTVRKKSRPLKITIFNRNFECSYWEEDEVMRAGADEDKDNRLHDKPNDYELSRLLEG